jgi:hypothetical protein
MQIVDTLAGAMSLITAGSRSGGAAENHPATVRSSFRICRIREVAILALWVPLHPEVIPNESKIVTTIDGVFTNGDNVQPTTASGEYNDDQKNTRLGRQRGA